MSADTAEPRGLAFDRRVSIALIVAVALETAGALIWAGAAAQRLSQLEGRVVEMAGLNERLARLEEQMSGAREQLARIEANTDRARRD